MSDLVEKKCSYKGDLPCAQPHLRCKACPVYRAANMSFIKEALQKYRNTTTLNPKPYIKIVTTREGPGLEVGVEGTF